MKNLRVAWKLGLGFGAVGLLLLLLAVSAWMSLVKVDTMVDLIVEDRYVKVMMVRDIDGELNQQARLTRNIVIFDDAQQRKTQLDQLATSRKEARALYDKLAELIKSEEGKALMAQALTAREAYKKSLDKFVTQAEANDATLRETLLTDVRPAQLAYEKELTSLSKFQTQLMETDAKASQASVDRGAMGHRCHGRAGPGLGGVCGAAGHREHRQADPAPGGVSGHPGRRRLVDRSGDGPRR